MANYWKLNSLLVLPGPKDYTSDFYRVTQTGTPIDQQLAAVSTRLDENGRQWADLMGQMEKGRRRDLEFPLRTLLWSVQGTLTMIKIALRLLRDPGYEDENKATYLDTFQEYFTTATSLEEKIRPVMRDFYPPVGVRPIRTAFDYRDLSMPSPAFRFENEETDSIDQMLKDVVGGWLIQKAITFGSKIIGGTIYSVQSLNQFLNALFERFFPESLYNTNFKNIALKTGLVVPLAWFFVKKSGVLVTECMRYIVSLFVGTPQPPPEVPTSLLAQIQAQWSKIANIDAAFLQTTYSLCVAYFGGFYKTASVLAALICAIVGLVMVKKLYSSPPQPDDYVVIRPNKRRGSKINTRLKRTKNSLKSPQRFVRNDRG